MISSELEYRRKKLTRMTIESNEKEEKTTRKKSFSRSSIRYQIERRNIDLLTSDMYTPVKKEVKAAEPNR